MVHSELLCLAEEKGWDSEALESAYQYVLGRGLRNVQRYGRPVPSPGRKRKAQMEYEFDVDLLEGKLVIRDRSGGERSVPLLSLPPGDFHLY